MVSKNFFVFGRKLGGNLSTCSLSASVASKYGRGGASKGLRSVYTALRSYYVALSGRTLADISARHLYIGEDENENVYVELSEASIPDQIQVGILKKDTRQIKAGIYNTATKSIEDVYKYGTGAHDNALGICLLLAEILAEDEAFSLYEEMVSHGFLALDETDVKWLSSGVDIDKFNELICLMSDNIYRRVTSENIKVNDTATGHYNAITLKELKQDLKTFCGTPKVFKASSKKAKASSTSSVAEYNGKYALSTRSYTEEEKMMIPVIPEGYNLPEYIIKDAQIIQASSAFKTPIRNIMLSGKAGTGKTESTRMLCALLNIPYTKTTCSVDTDIFSLLGQVYPNMGSSTPINYDRYLTEKGLPQPVDIEFDAAGSYEKLTGKKAPEGLDTTECYSILVSKILSEVKKDCEKDKDLIYVESDLIKAIRNGYGHEIQEPTVIKRAGVLVGLNALLENGDGAFITLPTGEVVKKHPDCVIVITTNTDYEGCSMINQSVLSRMDLNEVIEAPADDEIIARLQYKTGFNDLTVMRSMVKVLRDLEKCCTDEQITDGVIGMRELENWIKVVMIQKVVQGLSDVDVIPSELIYEAALTTLINKGSQTEEDRLQLLSVLENTFSA